MRGYLKPEWSSTRPPTHEPWGGYMAIFADPDGNTFYLDQNQVPSD